MLRLAGVLVVLVLVGCEIAETPRAQPATERVTAAAPLVNRAWLATDEDAAPGSLRVFLEDGTLLMTSCAEVYRIARWEVRPDGRISWDEDGAGVDAGVVLQQTDSLVLDVSAGPDRQLRHFVSSTSPYVCPEMPR